MKNYLDLVPISAKVHRKHNRMSIICIVLAVFLVTAIFGMADMFIRGQILQTQAEKGNWHIGLRGVSDEDAALLASRPEVAAVSGYSVLNFHGELGYTLSGKEAIICGSNESFVTDIFDMLTEGTFPKQTNEALISSNAKDMLGLKIGDSFLIKVPGETDLTYVISGFISNTEKLMGEDSYGVFLGIDGFRSIYPSGKDGDSLHYNTMYYVQLADTKNVQSEIAAIREQFGFSAEQISENTQLLGLLGQSSNSFMMQIYAVAGILFVFVLISGIMMIASSLNSNVVQRTEFFGLVRCIGAAPKQVMRLVRKEALNWCRCAIPIGVAAGTVLVWILCFILRKLSPEYFSGMPAFSISLPSIIAGIAVGLLTVLFAARSPAKRASKVSPLSAVSGNANDLQPVKKAVNTTFFKVDTSLGIHHAKASKKNFILMVGSFSISIILFLSFSVTIDFMNHALTPLRPWTADISVISQDNTCSVKSSFIEELNNNPAVKKVFGRMFAYDVPVNVNGEERKVDLITYEEEQFKWAEDYLLSGSVDTVQNEINTGLIVYEVQNSFAVGDTITLDVNGNPTDIKIVGLLSECPFDNSADVGKLICSESTFVQLTGENDYTVIDIQLSKKAAESDVDALHKMVGSQHTFSDKRIGNSSVRGAYYCFGIFIYGFLVLIALITIFNVVNSIAMSVAARMKQYGVFRAIGLSNRQLVKMIVAEASTYVVMGCIFGSLFGVLCNKILFEKLVGFQWGDPWKIPFTELGAIIVVVAVAVVLAVCRPIKKIKEMSIVDTISAQ